MSNVQNTDKALKEEDCEPWYEPEDDACNCLNQGIEPEWEWDCEQGCYRCNSCGEIQ